MGLFLVLVACAIVGVLAAWWLVHQTRDINDLTKF
jgi:Ca2+/Na+ antiporter